MVGGLAVFVRLQVVCQQVVKEWRFPRPAAGTPFAFKLSTILKDREASAESVFRTQGRGFLFQLRKIHR